MSAAVEYEPAEIVYVDRQIRELQVLQDELSTLRKNATVYQQQPNSQVFFLASRGRCQDECRKKIEKLEREKTAMRQRSTHQSSPGANK
ncbi:ASNSD1 upstream open reading frame protein-like [Diadema antillarum]|uniref:ASNSD1 upstream open reading frame protein-like n=1 Tax=Diadema antillarum TaxID=105358 RepID=UPI003A879E07